MTKKTERIRLGKITRQLGELVRLNDLIEENKKNKEVTKILKEAAIQPILLLEKLGVERDFSKTFFIIKAKLTYDTVLQFSKDYTPAPAAPKFHVTEYGKYSVLKGKGCMLCTFSHLKPKKCYWCLTTYG